MPDSKITALASTGTGTDPILDQMVIVDVSDISMAGTGTTKKVSLNQLLACSPTATLASATITGAATVGTTLGVTGVSTFAAGTALLPALTTTGDTNTGIYYPAADTFAVTTGGTERYRVDSSGNVGIGVTPSAWQTGLKALQFGGNGVLYANGGNSAFFGNNFYTDSAGTNRYLTSTVAAAYGQVTGAHQWFTAPTGTAGNPISGANAFVQAMTLDASGNLLVGTVTSPTGAKIGAIAKLSTVSLEGTASIAVSTTAVTLSRVSGLGGLFFVQGYADGSGVQAWWLVAANNTTTAVIASGNTTGLVPTFTMVGAQLKMVLASGTFYATSFNITA